MTTVAASTDATVGPAPSRPHRKPSAIGWLVTPALALFIVFFVLPFGVMALFTILTGNPLQRPDVTFTTHNWERLASDALYWESLVATLRIGLFTTIAALLIGYPLAHMMARTRSSLVHALLLMAVITPMLTGIVVRTFAWITILSDQGVINTTLAGLGLITAPLPLMYNEFGVTVALVHIFVPFMVLTLVGVIGRIDERIEEAAIVHGASPLRAFLEVTLPLSLPGIMAGSLLVFALTISSYVTPYLLGGTDVLTLPMMIYSQIAASFNPAFAGTLGMLLLAVALVLVVAYNNVLGRLSRRGDLA
jgi:putative spermidine/putrescine transport system permease protein